LKTIFTNTEEPEGPTDTKGLYEKIQHYLYDQRRTEENEEEWESIIVDMIDNQEDLEETLQPSSPVVTSKRQSAIWYDRFSQLLAKLDFYVSANLNLVPDQPQTLKRSILVLNSLAGGFLIVPSWGFHFLNGEILDRACDKEERILENRFQYAQEMRWTEKSCGVLNQQMEVIRMFENLIENCK